MFIVSLSSSRAVSVLLGGSGLCQQVCHVKRDVGALLSPRKPQTGPRTIVSVLPASVRSLWQPDGHD